MSMYDIGRILVHVLKWCVIFDSVKQQQGEGGRTKNVAVRTPVRSNIRIFKRMNR